MACLEIASGGSLPSVDAASDSTELRCARSAIACDEDNATNTLSFTDRAGGEAKAKQMCAPCFADVGRPNVKREFCSTKRRSSGNSISSGAIRGGDRRGTPTHGRHRTAPLSKAHHVVHWLSLFPVSLFLTVRARYRLYVLVHDKRAITPGGVLRIGYCSIINPRSRYESVSFTH